MNVDANVVDQPWHHRTWVLAALGAIFALAIQTLTDLPDTGWDWGKRLIAATVILLVTSGIAFGLSWQRGRAVSAALMALLCGVIAGGVMLWNGLSSSSYGLWSWPLCSGVVSAAVFLVLFQAAQGRHPHLPDHWSLTAIRDWKRKALTYADVHEAAWVDAIMIGLCAIFAAIVMGIAFLLAAMFSLVKIELLRELLEKPWVAALIIGGAYGGAMGLLRDRVQIIAALQRVAMIVLRVLAPVLGFGLVAFLAVLPFTGLAPLWATGSTTPIMLSAAIIALFLVNAVIGDGRDHALPARPLRWGATALALALLPLVVIAAWSTGLRIDQRGLSPDRLWALTFIILATVTAVAYAVAILSRGDWIARLFRSNLHLAFLLGAISLLLSTSLISFDRLATADQLGRLASGRTKPVDFDYRGLWFDFGPPGKAAIRQLAAGSPNAEIRKYAASAQKLEYRYGETLNVVEKQRGESLQSRLTILPRSVPLDDDLRTLLVSYDACKPEGGQCILRYEEGADYAVGVSMPEKDCEGCSPRVFLLYKGDRWASAGNLSQETNLFHDSSQKQSDAAATAAARQEADRQLAAAVEAGKFELRTVERRQLFINGAPFVALIPPEKAGRQ
jgi:hypothetical protein